MIDDLTIQALLHSIQTKMHVAKDKKNEFGGYNYRTAEGILAAIKPHLPAGASVTLTDAMSDVAGQIFVVSTATLMMADGQSHSTQGAALHPLTKKGMDPSQITGAASSYARKYALCGLAAIDDGKEDIDGRQQAYEPEPSFDADGATQRILTSIKKKTDQDDLSALWRSEKEIMARLPDDQFEKVKDAFSTAMQKLAQQQDAEEAYP